MKLDGVIMEQNVYKRYVVRFVGLCLGLFIVASFLPVPSLFNLLLAAGSAFYAGRLFAKDHGRVPLAAEQNRFAGVGFLVLMGLVFLITALILALSSQEVRDAFFIPFQETSLAAIVVGIFLAVLMMWGCIHFGFGLGARMYMKKNKVVS